MIPPRDRRASGEPVPGSNTERADVGGGAMGALRLNGALRRFTGGERWVHWNVAALMVVCVVTAAFLYVGPLAVLAGRRRVIELIHVYAGFGLPVPILLGWLSRGFRRDAARLNRFSPKDWEWLRSRDRRSGRIIVGKFNAGQKLNAAFITGSIVVMLGSGVMLFWPDLLGLPVSLRSGATFVHDWLAFAIFIVLLGHVWYATREPESLRGMWTGRVPRSWAARHHAGWLAEQDAGGEPAVASHGRADGPQEAAPPG
jgi:formate dehydrogenase subunit gamma